MTVKNEWIEKRSITIHLILKRKRKSFIFFDYLNAFKLSNLFVFHANTPFTL
jgi:hypothetical protein